MPIDEAAAELARADAAREIEVSAMTDAVRRAFAPP